MSTAQTNPTRATRPIELGGQLRWATMIERYTAQTVKDLPIFARVGGGLGALFTGKVLVDGVLYLEAEGFCAWTGH